MKCEGIFYRLGIAKIILKLNVKGAIWGLSHL